MGRSRRSPSPPPRENRSFTPEEAAAAKDRLQKRLSELGGLNPKQPDYTRAAEIALDSARSTVRDAFGQESDEAIAFTVALAQAGEPITWSPYGEGGPDPEVQKRRNAVMRVQEATARLEHLVGVVDEKTIRGVDDRPAPTAAAPPTSRRVFVVHGRNQTVKSEVARTLERLGLEPIVLHEQPDGGRTIIEKLEDHAEDVAFAVVLMTGDDQGGPKAAAPGTYQLRARQNVVLELGLFLGKLGRSRVRVLHEAGVEMPSDYLSVLYIPLDTGGAWQLRLVREMRSAGLDVDANRL